MAMRDICLFAHFDEDDTVDDYVLRYLTKLRELDFSIVFVSASRLAPAEVERLRDTCFDVILRENAGLDFGSWAAGFAKHGYNIGGRLLLANDSIYGPVGDLRTALDRLTRTEADFYGMVESIEIAPHLQSWFVLLQPWIVCNPEFRSILAQPFGKMTRRQIVHEGETGLSRRLLNAGFRYEALHRNNRAVLPRRHDVNPMLLFWRELLFDDGIPFLKIELLRDNPLGGEDAATILETVETVDAALGRLIESHLARTVRRPPRSALAQRRYALIRRRYELASENRLATAAWNNAKLEAVTAAVWAWRLLRKAIARR
jgi:lipopolysaccharide biosynthesis protein